MAVLIRQDGTKIIRRNQAGVCCAERLVLQDLEHNDDANHQPLMVVVKVQVKPNGWSLGSSRPCMRCVEALRESRVCQVIWSEKKGQEVSFKGTLASELPDNDYSARA